MDVYGLTGGIGSGKTTVAELLEDYGVPVVSADELSRIVVSRGSEGLADVVRTFGPEVLDDRGELDRRKMASIVFQDPGKRRQLEAILHPRIRERFEQVLDALEKAGHEVAVYEVPLLFERNLQGEMQAVILVTADQAVRTRRVQARDDITETEIRARMAAQMDETLKRKRADYIIENNGSMDELRREVEFLLDRFMRVGARRAAANMGDQSSTRMSMDEVEQEDGTASRVRTEIPSSAGLPIDGQPPMLGPWQTRTVTAPAEPVPVRAVTAPSEAVPLASESPLESMEPPRTEVDPPRPADGPIESPTTRRSKTMPAIPMVSLEPPSSFATPVAPGMASRSGTPPVPAPGSPMSTPLQGPPTGPVDASISSTVRTEGVPTEAPQPTHAPVADAAIVSGASAVPSEVPREPTPPSPTAASDPDEDEEPSTARAGNPSALVESEPGLVSGPRRRKTMPASHFVELRPPGSGQTVPAPPSPIAPTVPNVPPPPTPGAAATSDSSGTPPPPPPPPIKRNE
jgi:dephospho-CoA kinase